MRSRQVGEPCDGCVGHHGLVHVTLFGYKVVRLSDERQAIPERASSGKLLGQIVSTARKGDSHQLCYPVIRVGAGPGDEVMELTKAMEGRMAR